MARHASARLATVLMVLAGCDPASKSSPAPRAGGSPATANPQGVENGAARLASATLSAEELSDLLELDVDVYTFAYTGGSVRCWLEIDDNGAKSIKPPDGVGVTHSSVSSKEYAEEGRIVLWWKRGELNLRILSVGGSGGHSSSLPDGALWWGWKGHDGRLYKLEEPVTPDSGKEVVLLHYAATESKSSAADPENPRDVIVVLKAEFPE